ncbi:MAG: RNA polymerase sigma factor, partial [Clostridia bacterium]|nr:RNA polymerase sigma factor [Clostridia bacterium]
DKHSDMLFRLALAQLGNSEDAMDAVHDVFLKFFDTQPDFKDGEHERAWFIRSTVNRCHDIQRHKKIRSHPSLDEIGDVASNDDGEATKQIYRALSALPEKYSSVITLHYLEGFSVEEIASMLRITQSGIKMRLSRGRETLKKLIETEEE